MRYFEAFDFDRVIPVDLVLVPVKRQHRLAVVQHGFNMNGAIPQQFQVGERVAGRNSCRVRRPYKCA